MSTTHSHLMKTSRRGRPFVKDTHDLFATLIISLTLDTHRNFFKVYPNSFTTDEAAANLSSLKFSQSNRSPDPKDPSRIVTTTTTTTFSMEREMAKGICQHFMDAALIENAADLNSSTFKERGIYMITPKGLHVLERFITKNGITAPHTLRLFAQQPICLKLLHLDRRSSDDEINVTRSAVEVVWRRLIGRSPNLSILSDDDIVAQKLLRWHVRSSVVAADEVDRSRGLVLRRIAAILKSDRRDSEYHFPAISAIDWLCEFTTCAGQDEAADLAAHFVRYGWISLVSDKGRVKEGNFIATVKSEHAVNGAGGTSQEVEFRVTEKAVYRITQEGIQAAGWERSKGNESRTSLSLKSIHAEDEASSSMSRHRPSISSSDTGLTLATARARPGLTRKPSSMERSHSDYSDRTDKDIHARDSHTARLKSILDEPAQRSLFREFLKANFCEENLTFWLDVQDFKRRFNTTSSAVATPGAGKGARTGGPQAMEIHQQELMALALVIYTTYLAPDSPLELNIDHYLHHELISYMNQVKSDKDAGVKGRSEPGIGNTLHASQLQTTIKLYERIQTYIFRLMATDSVPKFCKTKSYLELMDYNDQNLDNDISDLRSHMDGLSFIEGSPEMDTQHRSPTRAYITISQAANEKQANLLHKQHAERAR